MRPIIVAGGFDRETAAEDPRPSIWHPQVTGRLRQRSWETPEGDKRSVTELEADEVGASLKWATAKVERSS
jgi:hypothetical protein